MRRLAPYLLLGVLVAGTGLGIGLGLAMAPTVTSRSGALSEVTTHLVLSRTHVVAGQRIKATLVVTNRSGHPIKLRQGCGPTDFAIALASPTYKPRVTFAALACQASPFIVPPGITSRSYTVFTSYLVCTEPGGSSADPSIPQCPLGGGMPPLPPGRYHTVLVSDGARLPAPPPVTVVLSS